MKGIVNFAFEDHLVRVIEREGEPWFVATDVCRVLGIANSRDALSKLDEDEKGVGLTDTLGGQQQVSVITESGLYALAFASRKPEAKRFRKWVTSDVLPTIRKTGGFAHLDSGSAAVQAQLDMLDRALSACREIRLTWGCKAARRFWINSGLLELYNPESDLENLVDATLYLFLREKCEVTGSRDDFTRSRDLLDALLFYLDSRDLPRMGLREASIALRALSVAYRDLSTGAQFWHHKRSNTGYCGVKLLP
ncbi:Bro-N domain-containing protein [Ruegeria lacuscaerulensis]|uniref:BRO-N domain-containing protein n=1 Tax=Ruegeria lacuscaerulensis TaxID=55218 RepID=UPI0014814705|nr:Bro-N domain-containing protein [Ruegeria lacuscaerulensis]